jgi:CheY-like chemotaxis protein
MDDPLPPDSPPSAPPPRASEPQPGTAPPGPLLEGLWTRDLVTGVAWYSRRYKSLLGFTDVEMEDDANHFRDRVHPGDLESLERQYAKAVATFRPTPVGGRMLHRDGTWRAMRGLVRVWPDADGRPAHLTGSLFEEHDEPAFQAGLVLLHERLEQASLDAGQPAPAASTSVTPTAVTTRSGVVLVVDDNAVNQVIATEMVKALGGSAAQADNAEDAIRFCVETPPGLVLMDIRMPGMDGLECTRQLRKLQLEGKLPAFPIIALTAHAAAADREASLTAGMDEHLTKPIHLERLRLVLGQWLPPVLA